MIDKFKPKPPRLPYPFIPPFDPPAEHHRIFHRRVLEATMKDLKRRPRPTRPPWWPEDWPWPPPPMNLWLSKRRHHSLTSSGRGSHQIIPTTCRQVITIPIICPKAIQVTITLACHRIL